MNDKNLMITDAGDFADLELFADELDERINALQAAGSVSSSTCISSASCGGTSSASCACCFSSLCSA